MLTWLLPPPIRPGREPWVEPGNRITRAIWDSIERPAEEHVEYPMGARPVADKPDAEKPGKDANDAAA